LLTAWSNQTTVPNNRLIELVEQRAAYDVKYDSPAMARKKLAAAASRWPNDARKFASDLRLVTPQLRLHGLAIESSMLRTWTRIAIRYSNPPAKKSPRPTLPNAAPSHPGWPAPAMDQDDRS
jgi:hypothetical protein